MITNIRNAKEYIQAFLKIKTKDNKIVPFLLNEPQLKLYDVIKQQSKKQVPIRLIILKARQMGFSTLTEALIFHRTATKENISSMIITHKDEATTNLFNMSKLFFDYLPVILKPMKKASNAKEIIFENPTKKDIQKLSNPGLRSKIKCATAGGDGVGRSDTLTNVHASEYAFWTGDKKATLSGLLQAVPPLANTLVIIESTANGFDDFKNMWDMAVAGQNDFVPVFFAWFEMDEYRKKYDGFTFTKEEIDIQSAYKLDNEQIAWRRWCIANNCSGDVNQFKQEYPATPEDAFISTGSCVFDKASVILRINALKGTKPVKQGHFEYRTCFDTDSNEIAIDNKSIVWIEDSEGYIKIYVDVKPCYPYVIGGDTAGDGSDNFIGQVLDNTTGEQVAKLKHTFDEDLYAKQMYCLGHYYNTAMIAIESNYTSYPLKELQKLGYKRQYYRETADRITNKMQYKYGFRTDSVTRPLIIAGLKTIVRDNIELINDIDTLREMLTFIKNSHGRPEAMNGEHDDCIMALAIAHNVRPQQMVAVALPLEEMEQNFYDDVSDFIGYS